MKEIRCVKCNKLLGKFHNVDGQIKCTKCKTLNNLTTQIESVQAPNNN
jgi:phage FluMu protein Com